MKYYADGARLKSPFKPAVCAVVLGSALLAATGCGPVNRIAEGTAHPVVASFDARTTVRTLQRTESGGVEKVVARDPSDAEQVAFVRATLSARLTQFRQGSYEDPARAHGMVMPGSRELERAYAEVTVAYTELPAGGQISYTASTPALVEVIHAWFDRLELVH